MLDTSWCKCNSPW